MNIITVLQRDTRRGQDVTRGAGRKRERTAIDDQDGLRLGRRLRTGSRAASRQDGGQREVQEGSWGHAELKACPGRQPGGTQRLRLTAAAFRP